MRQTSAAALSVVALLGAATVPAGAAGVGLQLTVNRTVVSANDELRMEVTTENQDVSPIVGDLFVGVLLPRWIGASVGCPGGDPVLFLVPAPSEAPMTCLSSSVATFTALLSHFEIPVGSHGLSSLLVAWPESAPAGTYTLFAALLSPGATGDGGVDAHEVLALTAQDVVSATLSDAARGLVRAYNQDVYGAITRWVKSPILIWTDPAFPRDDLIQAISLWHETIGPTGLLLQPTDDQAAADILFRFGALPAGTPPGSCGVEGPSRVTNHVIEAGEGVYLRTPECTGAGTAGPTALAHGIGHILGFAGHTPSNTDVMSAPLVPFLMSETLGSALRFIYSVAPGTVLP